MSRSTLGAAPKGRPAPPLIATGRLEPTSTDVKQRASPASTVRDILALLGDVVLLWCYPLTKKPHMREWSKFTVDRMKDPAIREEMSALAGCELRFRDYWPDVEEARFSSA